MGCIAVCELEYHGFNKPIKFKEITSFGLWGIESDLSTKDKMEYEQEQYDDLKHELKEMGIKIRLPKIKDIESEYA